MCRPSGKLIIKLHKIMNFNLSFEKRQMYILQGFHENLTVTCNSVNNMQVIFCCGL